MITQELAAYHNRRMHDVDDDSDALAQDIENAINDVFDIRGEMFSIANEISQQLR